MTGGIDLAAERAGFKTVGQCEWADYPTKVLEKHWPDVPRWRDIRSVTAESVRERGIGAINLISGGFPCQPFSVAGKQRGKEDDRFLWPEMLRVISELQPDWVIGENVPGIVNMALDQVLSDLEGKGYEVQAFLIPACGVEAHHKRERVFIVANTKRNGLTTPERTRSTNEADGEEQTGQDNAFNIKGTGGIRGNVADTNSAGLQGCEETRNIKSSRENSNEQLAGYGGIKEILADTEHKRPILSESAARHRQELSESGNIAKPKYYECGGEGYWDIEPDVGRVANGVPSRVDRLKCLGNAVVPQQVYPLLQAIADIENTLLK